MLLRERLTDKFYQYLEQLLKHWISPDFFKKGTAHCHICRALSNISFGKASLINFVSTGKNSLKHCIFAEFLLIVIYVEGFLRKKLFLAPFVEHFRATCLRKFH